MDNKPCCYNCYWRRSFNNIHESEYGSCITPYCFVLEKVLDDNPFKLTLCKDFKYQDTILSWKDEDGNKKKGIL